MEKQCSTFWKNKKIPNKITMYILAEDVERVIFRIIQSSTASDIKKYIKPMTEWELDEYKKDFMNANFKFYATTNQ